MKRNKKLIWASVLLFVVCIICFAIAIIECLGVDEYLKITFGDNASSEDKWFGSVGVFALIVTIIFEVVEGVFCILFGRKLLKFSKVITPMALREIKNISIVCYVFAVLSFGSSILTIIAFACMLTAGIILTVFLNKINSSKNLGDVKIEVFDKTNPNTQSDMISSQITMLDELHNAKVISDNDYNELIRKVLGIDKDNQPSDSGEIIINQNDKPKGDE